MAKATVSKAKAPTKAKAPVVVQEVDQVQSAIDLLKSMSPEELIALRQGMKAQEIVLPRSNAKGPKVYVAVRHQLEDTGANAKKQRKANEMERLTERQLQSTLECWVRKDADVRIPAILKGLENGHKESFSKFEILPISAWVETES